MVTNVLTTPKVETLEELVAVIRELGCRWYDSKERGIRTRDIRKERKHKPRFCPITAVCFYLTGKFYGEGKWQLAAEHIGLPSKIALTVQRAADNNFHGDSYCAQVRQVLLDACGLTKA